MERDYYDLVGEEAVREMSIGFEWGGLIDAAAGVTKAGIKQKTDADTAAKSKSDAEAALNKSLSADAMWANAEANLELQSSDPTASAAGRVVRDSAQSDASSAAAALNDDGKKARCAKAQENLKSATADMNLKSDAAKKAKVHAWQKVVAACGGSSFDAGAGASASGGKAGGKYHEGGGSFLTNTYGGLPTWGWGLVGVGGLTVVVFIARSMMKRKR